ncbi:MAG: fibronectin type III domain-containing protein, partial [Gammaproteobacteria bacterium]|nr:fibronectin type III domain-containing protein [Gammaproteobacteria bacterium]
PPPGAPQNVRADTAEAGELAVAWSAPASDGGTPVATYHLRWKPLGASAHAPADRAAVDAPAISYDIPGLTNGTTYEVQVAAETIGGLGAYSDAALGVARGGICDRTEQVHAEVVRQTGRAGCAAITDDDLQALTELPLSGKEITALTANDFTGMRDLRTLRLTDNSLATLPDGVFAGLEELQTLLLDGNALTALPDGIFADLAKLQTLKLRDNELGALPQKAIADTPNLSALDVSENSITALPANAFADMDKLRILSVGGNAFTTLPVNVFAGLPHLGQLDLRNNALTALPSGVFNGLSPGVVAVRGMDLPAPPGEVRLVSRESQLQAEWDAVAGAQYQLRWKLAAAATFAPEDALALGATRHTITGLQNGATYELRVATVPAAPVANMAANGMWGFAAARAAPFPPPSAPQNVRMLQAKPASLAVSWSPPANNGGAPVFAYHLRWKLLSASDFAADDTAEVRAPALSYDITGLTNGEIYQVQVAAETLGGAGAYTASVQNFPQAGICDRTEQVHAEVVRQLALAGCAAVTDAHLRSIAEMNLQSKSISELTANAFAGMDNLEILRLHKNSLSALPAGLFSGLAKLHTLNLRGNDITTFAANVFSELSELQELHVGGNPLNSLPGELFSGLTKLRELSLNNNGLSTLPADVFAGLAKLQTLQLHNNPLATLPVGAFNGLTPGALRITGMELPAPPQLRLVAREGELRAEWDAVANAHYHVRWRADFAAEFASGDAVATAETQYTIPGLTNGTTYEIRAASVPSAPQAATKPSSSGPVPDNEPRDWRYSAIHGAPLDDPGAPQNLRVVSAEEGKVVVAWQAPRNDGGSPVTAYRVRWKPAAATTFATENSADRPASELQYEIGGLTNGAAYEVRVAAVTMIGAGDESGAVRATPLGRPGAPRELRAQNVNSRELLVSWSAPADNGGSPVTAYSLRWKTLAAADYAPADNAEVRASAPAYAITGLTNGATYELQVAAKNAIGLGAYSDAARGVPLRGVCGRIAAVRDEIVKQSGRAGCAEVSEEDLLAISELDLRNKSIANLPEDAFAGMRGLTSL